MSIAPVPPDGFAVRVPLVIVGSGAAGLVAALAARDAGASEILVLERDRLPRGSTALSAGLIPAAGTRWQKAAGIEDSPALAAQDVMAKTKGLADPALVRIVTEAIGPVLEWLADAHGLPFSVIDSFRYPGHSAYRMHGLPSRSGAELVDALARAAEAQGIDVLCEAQVDTLHVEAGAVRGVGLLRPDGTRETIGCAALILACNGYGGNRDLVARHIPALVDALYFGHPGNQGDALAWGQALGAATRHLSGHQGHGSVAHPHGILITWATMTEGGFQVNRHGERFSDESGGYSEQAEAVLAQPDGIAFSIFDEHIATIARQFEDFREAERLGAVLAAESIADLAAALGIPPAALARTVAEIDEARERGVTDRFGRSFAGLPALAPPYRAVRVTGALFHTQGGLVVDERARVLDEAGQPIPGLFAAGGAACGVSGPDPAGYLSGNGLLTAMALGAIAGREAVRR